MVNKKSKKKKISGFQRIEKDVEKDVKSAEKWVSQRRIFFIKLGLVVVFVIILLLIASLL